MTAPQMARDPDIVSDFNKAVGIAIEAAERNNATYAVCTQHRLPPGPDWMVVMPLAKITHNVMFTAHALAQADGRCYTLDIPGPH